MFMLSALTDAITGVIISMIAIIKKEKPIEE
nr:MAG TPA: hypothetical protein [Caudoviricetes sp.]